ncbi:hypothetical protein DPMN_060455 [Dreissena polymorpha]|uniref:Uncharacterized protein n=1 Tax=Dreissena polymorpha TaxID=45954 RepID=A0A9D4C5X6_DREPO|nr:hypothetical protein DPMN_060455 [Dreissena polymorpha]
MLCPNTTPSQPIPLLSLPMWTTTSMSQIASNSPQKYASEWQTAYSYSSGSRTRSP